MSLTKNSLQDLIATGDDALSSQYDVCYTFSDQYTNNTAEKYLFKVRMGDFQIPSIARKSLNLDYQNLKVPIPVDHVPLDRSSKFSFRLDSNLELYKLFAARIKKGDVYKPFYERGDTSCLDTISVVYTKPITLEGATYEEALDYLSNRGSYEKESYRWTFKNVILTQLEIGSFTRASSDPLKATVSFNFSYISEDADTLRNPVEPERNLSPESRFLLEEMERQPNYL